MIITIRRDALRDNETGPGHWGVEAEWDVAGRPAIALIYRVECSGGGPEPHPDFVYADMPWSAWGGNAILAAAGMETFTGMAEGYTDKYGDDMYADAGAESQTEDVPAEQRF